MLDFGIFIAFLYMLSGAVETTMAKHVVRRLGNYRFATAILCIGIIPLLAYAALIGIHSISDRAVLLSMAAGVLSGAAYIMYYKGLETQQMTNVATLLEVQTALLFLFGVFVLGESLSAVDIIGIIAIFSGAVLMMTTNKMKLNMMLLPVIIANALWAGQWIFLNYAISSYGSLSLPVLIVRVMAFAFVASYFVFLVKKDSTKIAPRKGMITYALAFFLIAIGIIDGSINVLFGLLVKDNLVAIGSAIYSTMPIVAALFGRMVYRDGLSDLQKIGLVIAVVGAIAIGIG